MRHAVTVLISIFALATSGPALLKDRRMGAINQISRKGPKPLTSILSRIGGDYDCFFTIESAWQEGESANTLESEWTERTLAMGGLGQELEQIRQKIPNYSYQFNLMDPRIVHVIDERLTQQKGYAFSATIRSLDFAGTVNELPDAIGKQGIPIALPTWQSTHEQRDGSTVVHIKGQGLSVRSALSNFIDLDSRERILWIARTKQQQAITYVYYPWPGRMNKR